MAVAEDSRHHSSVNLTFFFFFISFLNPFAEYKVIFKTQFAQEVPNI